MCTNTRKICVKADAQNIDEVFDFIEGELADIEGVCRQDVLKMHMVVDEIFSNITNYAYEEEAGDVIISFNHEPGSDCISMTFTDQGRPYNPMEEVVPDINLPAGKRKVGGLGVFMVRNTVDDIHYENMDGSNILTITKRIGQEQD
jgi:anti-sigma regulatory factor (Ser/Thr protein kinase)